MLNVLFLVWGLIPVTIGFGLIFRPKKVVKAQSGFRKRMERMEKRLFKAHRATGLSFVLLGVVLLLSYFHPVWIFNIFLVARLLVGFFFPGLFQSHVAQIVPTVWI